MGLEILCGPRFPDFFCVLGRSRCCIFFSTLENVIHYGKAGQLSFKGETRKGGRLIRAVVVGGLPGGGV